MRNDDEIKEKLFGSVGRIKATGGHQVDLKKLLKPLEWKGGVMRVFCEGCGATFEVDRIMAEIYAEIANVELPVLWKSFTSKAKVAGCAIDATMLGQ